MNYTGLLPIGSIVTLNDMESQDVMIIGYCPRKAEENGKIANRVAAFEEILGRGKTIHVTLVTTHGLVHNKYWNDVHSEVTLDDLFAP